jgi:hypothetical protein
MGRLDGPKARGAAGDDRVDLERCRRPESFLEAITNFQVLEKGKESRTIVWVRVPERQVLKAWSPASALGRWWNP